MARREAEHCFKRRVPVKAAIVAKNEFVEICIDVLAAQAVIRAQSPPLQQREDPVKALSRELNLAARNLEVPVLAHAAVAARHVWNASSRRTRSVRRDVRWRWTLKVFWTAA